MLVKDWRRALGSGRSWLEKIFIEVIVFYLSGKESKIYVNVGITLPKFQTPVNSGFSIFALLK
jgi:hypothetical protein